MRLDQNVAVNTDGASDNGVAFNATINGNAAVARSH